ncbi:MAG: hypothetical protein ABJA80_00415 [bacterium]
MHKPTTAFRTLLTIAAVCAAMAVSACGNDATAPTSSPLAPGGADRALSGANDQTYAWTVDPTTDSPRLYFGDSYIVIPANAICDIAGSSYGAGHWMESCNPETKPVIITATVHNANTEHPSIDFAPAMRFNPAATLPTLLFSVTDKATLSNMSVVKYCTVALLSMSCVDESLADSALATSVDSWNNIVWRRIRHFSGYTVAE